MATQSKLTYRTLRLATIALGLACFHAYAVAGPGGSGRVATVGRTGGANSRISTFTSRQGTSKSGVESYAGQRTRGSKPGAVTRRSSPRAGAPADVSVAIARTQQRMAAKREAAAPALPAKNGATASSPTLSDPVLRAALAKPEARKADGMRNVFALRTAPTVAELIADSGVAAGPRAVGSSH
jgi:hypothetical protein